MSGTRPLRHLAIFASGGGSNAAQIIQYFKESKEISISLIITNNKNAGVRDIASQFGIPHIFCSKTRLADKEKTLTLLYKYKINGIILAGFLAHIPEYLTTLFPDKILNIHPALLPAYGGQGMHGLHVHEAVYAAGEKVSGLTIHLVNERYDEGKIIFQCRVPLIKGSTPEEIAQQVLKYEHYCYPLVIKQFFAKNGD